MHFKVYGYISTFFPPPTHSSQQFLLKEITFVTSCLVLWTRKPLPHPPPPHTHTQNVIYFLKKINLFLEEQFSPFRTDPTEKRDKNRNGRVVTPKCVPIHLNRQAAVKVTAYYICTLLYILCQISNYCIYLVIRRVSPELQMRGAKRII